MTELDRLYLQLLAIGFIVLREAIGAEDFEWAASELELMHNVPSLIGETSAARHEYFWVQERTRYIEWASAPGREMQKSRMLTFYEPIWGQMEPLVRADLQ